MFKKMFPKKERQNVLKTVEATIDDVRNAIHEYSSELPKGASLQILVNEDASLDYSLLAPYLNGVPAMMYYMSKETFELFDNPKVPLLMDKVQRAVDRYIGEYGKTPVIDGDPYHKISYFKLADYLKERPDIDFYLTQDENLITDKKPS